jgi:hypothetical protein
MLIVFLTTDSRRTNIVHEVLFLLVELPHSPVARAVMNKVPLYALGAEITTVLFYIPLV